MTKTYFDERFGDYFVIDFDPATTTVHSIIRYIDRAGRDPIRYSSINEAPVRVQEELLAVVREACKLIYSRKS